MRASVLKQMPNAKAMAKYFPAAFLEVWPTVPAFVRARFPYFTHVEVGFCRVRVWKLLLLSSYSSYVSKIFNRGWVAPNQASEDAAVSWFSEASRQSLSVI